MIDDLQEQDIGALAAGWVVADKVEVSPKDARPGDVIHISAFFRNQNWLPAYAVLELKLDGLVIDTYCTLLSCSVIFGPRETITWNAEYTLPASISTGASHRIEALEQEQLVPAYDDFVVSSPPPPGQRNVSFSSTPTGAQIYVSGAYRGDTPITIPLPPGTYAVKAIYSDQEVSRNIQVVSGSGTLPITFTFTQETPFDLSKFLMDNALYIGGGLAALALLYLAVKKPATVKRGYAAAKEYASRGVTKAKEVYRGVAEA